MRKFLLRGVLVIFTMVSFSLYSYEQVTIFSEAFDEASGSTSGSSAEGVAWSATCPSCPVAGSYDISGGAFENNHSSGPAVWTTDPMVVSNCQTFTLEVDYTGQPYVGGGAGSLESNTDCGPCPGDPNSPVGGGCTPCWDFSHFELILDGASAGFTTVGNGFNPNTPGPHALQFETCGALATSAELKVTMQHWGTGESASFDNITLICIEGENEEAIVGASSLCEDGLSSESYSVPATLGNYFHWQTTGGTITSTNFINEDVVIDWTGCTNFSDSIYRKSGCCAKFCCGRSRNGKSNRLCSNL